MLLLCDGCGTEEAILGNHKCCSACKQVYYCTKQCQRQHWREFHKKLCKKEPKYNIDNHSFKAVAELLISNYSGTVKKYGGYIVTEQQKKMLFPKLVTFLKDAVKENPELNSVKAFKDAGHDKDFNSKLDAFFEEQEGFESLVAIHKEPWARAFKEKQFSSDRIHVDEEMLASVSKTIASHFASCFAEDVDDSHHDLLMDVIMVELLKALSENPKYNSYQGFSKIGEDPEIMANITIKMVEAMAKENPDAWVDKDSKPKEQEVCVDEEEMVKFADCCIETMVIILRRLGKLENEPNRGFARDVVLLLIKEQVSTRPEYNSNETVQNLVDDEAFKKRMMDLALQLL